MPLPGDHEAPWLGSIRIWCGTEVQSALAEVARKRSLMVGDIFEEGQEKAPQLFEGPGVGPVSCSPAVGDHLHQNVTDIHSPSAFFEDSEAQAI